MKKILILLILIGAFIVRLYRVDNPIADWHSWRQADTSAVSRNFVKYGINLLKPQYDDLSNIASGQENPDGLRFVEFPIYNAFQAISYKLFPFISLEKWGRIITAILSVITSLFIYLIVKRYSGYWQSIFAAFFYAFLPFSIYYGRVILPDPSMVTFAMGSLWFMSEFREKNKSRFLVLSTFFFATALLLKPTAIFFILPIVYLIVFGENKFKSFFVLKNLIIFSLSLFPLLLWRWYMQNFPEGIPASSWLLNGDGIRFKGAWFRWIFGDRIGKLILGYWGIAFLAFGILVTENKKSRILHILAFSSLLYLIIFATGNVRHDYYQIPILPTVSIFCGIGLFNAIKFAVLINTSFLWNLKNKNIFIHISNFINWRLSVILFFFFLTFALSWYEVQGFFNINHPEIVEAGKKVDEIVPKNAKVIAPYGGDTAFLYQTNRKGWPIIYNINNINTQIKLGATHFVSTSLDEPTKKIMNKCKTLFQNDKFVIVELVCRK